MKLPLHFPVKRKKKNRTIQATCDLDKPPIPPSAKQRSSMPFVRHRLLRPSSHHIIASFELAHTGEGTRAARKRRNGILSSLFILRTHARSSPKRSTTPKHSIQYGIGREAVHGLCLNRLSWSSHADFGIFTQIEVGHGKKAIAIFVPVPSLQGFHRVQQR